MSVLPRTRFKLGWLSGASRMGNSALAPDQSRFMESLGAPAGVLLERNLPFERGSAAFVPTSLPVASVVNFARFLGASQPLRRRSAVQSWRAVKASCELLLLVTGSCGSQLASALERRAPEGAQVELLCLGPVDWRRSSLQRTDVIGAGDWISGLFGSEGAVRPAGIGHLDYLESEAVRELARGWVRGRLEQHGLSPLPEHEGQPA